MTVAYNSASKSLSMEGKTIGFWIRFVILLEILSISERLIDYHNQIVFTYLTFMHILFSHIVTSCGCIQQVTTSIQMSTHARNYSLMEENPTKASTVGPLALEATAHVCNITCAKSSFDAFPIPTLQCVASYEMYM